MKKSLSIILLTTSVIFLQNVKAQNVAINNNGTAANNSAMNIYAC